MQCLARSGKIHPVTGLAPKFDGSAQFGLDVCLRTCWSAPSPPAGVRRQAQGETSARRVKGVQAVIPRQQQPGTTRAKVLRSLARRTTAVGPRLGLDFHSLRPPSKPDCRISLISREQLAVSRIEFPVLNDRIPC